eukprot:4206732-Pleurochrysis_carterae.AAC.1
MDKDQRKRIRTQTHTQTCTEGSTRARKLTYTQLCASTQTMRKNAATSETARKQRVHTPNLPSTDCRWRYQQQGGISCQRSGAPSIYVSMFKSSGRRALWHTFLAASDNNVACSASWLRAAASAPSRSRKSGWATTAVPFQLLGVFCKLRCPPEPCDLCCSVAKLSTAFMFSPEPRPWPAPPAHTRPASSLAAAAAMTKNQRI